MIILKVEENSKEPLLATLLGTHHWLASRLLPDNLDTAIEALEIFHSLFLNLNRTNCGWCFHLRLEPATHSSCFRR